MNYDERYTVTLGDRGRLILPAHLRKRLNLRTGDRLVITIDSGGFRVVPAHVLAQRLRGLYRDLAPGRSRADELITERREESRREDAS